MRARRGLAPGVLTGFAALSIASIASIVSFASRPAYAQHAVDARAQVALSATYTEMLTQGPFPTLGALTGPSLAVSPGLVLRDETPRFMQDLIYGSSISVPIRLSSDAAERPTTMAHHLNYLSRFALNDRMEMMIDATASAVPNNTFIASQNAAETQIQVTPSAFSYNLVFSGSETLTRELSPVLRGNQSLNVTYGLPFQAGQVRASTFSVRNNLGLTREWLRDTGGLVFSSAYTHFGPSESKNNEVIEGRDTVVNTLALTWRRQLSETWTSSLDMGVAQVISPTAEVTQLFQPSGGGGLEYSLLDVAVGSLSYNHGAQLNAFTASINIIDQLSARVAIPLSVKGVTLLGSAGFQYARPLSPSGALQNGYVVGLGDVAIEYVPDRFPSLSAGLRGQVNQQSSLDDPSLSFTRLSVSLQVAYSYPHAKAAFVAPRVMPSRYGPLPEAGRAREREPEPEPELPRTTTPGR